MREHIKAEIRSSGELVIVYTEDPQVQQRLEQWQSCQQVVPYFQQARVVGVDLYFPQKLERKLRVALGLPPGEKRRPPSYRK